MTLNELIRQLSTIPARDDGSEKMVYFDFCGTFPTTVSSCRGIYAEPAIGWAGCGRWHSSERDNKLEAQTVASLLAELRGAIGKTFAGWKGGDYTYNGSEPIHVDNPGEYTSTEIVGVEDLGWRVVIHTRSEEG